jgi:hypothetical protein
MFIFVLAKQQIRKMYPLGLQNSRSEGGTFAACHRLESAVGVFCGESYADMKEQPVFAK